MKPLPSIIAAVIFSLALSAPASLSAQDSDPVRREEAGRTLEDFLLKADSQGRSFVSEDADRAALGADARDWANKADAGRLAALLFVAIPESRPEARLRAALADWTGKKRIDKGAARAAAAAFFADAAEKASTILNDPRTRRDFDAATAADHRGVLSPVQAQALERARSRGLRTAGTSLGDDRSPEDLGMDPASPMADRRPLRSADGGSAGTSGGAASVTAPVASAVAGSVAPGAYAPAANLPLNFRNRAKVDVPAPGTSGGASTAGGAGGKSKTGPETGARASASAGEVGEDDLRAVFDATVARLVREGKRRPGKGGVSGVINNMGAAFGPGVKYVRCYDQAEELLGDLDKSVSSKSGWTFRMTTYTGEGHEANGHYWVTAVSKKKEQRSLIMDAWLGEIRADASKNPVVIKPFLPWAMGAAMDKILPQ